MDLKVLLSPSANVAQKNAASTLPRLPVIDTAALFGQGQEIRIIHHGTEYRLRITKQGKLILTK
jgi:hemin uptake protein HemP